MKSILYISQQLPWPKTSGGNIRSYHILAALARRFAVSLVAGAPSEAQRQAGREALSGLCASLDIVADDRSRRPAAIVSALARSLARGVPAFIEYHLNPRIRRAVAARLAETDFDLLHVNHLDAMPYLQLAPRSRYAVDSHNILYQYFARRSRSERNPLRRAFFALESRRMERYEIGSFERARLVLTCSAAEKDSLLAAEPGLRVEVVPNGVDCEYFQPDRRDPFANEPELVFVGDMGYEPNHQAAVELARTILPGVRQRIPEAKVTIVGRNPRPELQAIADRRPDVTVTGFVDDVRSYVRRAKVFVVPIRFGSGTRLKILEAFAMAIPTVSTSIGAEGIDCRDGHDILIADEPRDLQDALCRVLSDRELYTRLRTNSRKTARERYDWQIIGRQLVDLYESL